MTVFTADDLQQLTACVSAAFRSAADRDWSASAGTLEWSCVHTAAHAVDTVIAPAFFLASRRQDAYPDGGWSPPDDATADDLADGLEMVTRILIAVVNDAPPDTRAIIWRRPTIEVRPPADFLPRGALELVLHAHDVCSGLGVDFTPPAEGCEHLRQHTRGWPFWEAMWQPLTMTATPGVTS